MAAGAAALAALVGLGSTGGVAGGPALATRSLPHPRYVPGYRCRTVCPTQCCKTALSSPTLRPYQT